METKNILITDYNFNNINLERAACENNSVGLFSSQCKTEDDVITEAQKIGSIHGLLVQHAPITRHVIESLPKLKAIGRYGIGVDVVDLEAATERGVYVVNVPDYCEEEVSDHALSLLLACAKKIVLLNNLVKTGNPNLNLARPIHRLSEQTVGLIGFGKIPRKLAQKLKSVEFDVLAYDPFVEKGVEEEYGIHLVDLQELLQKSDYVSLHVPLNNKTMHIIGKEELRQMKKSAFLINTARGALIDESSMIEALRSGKIAGAALDVLKDNDFSSSNPLMKMDNVILTPHSAWLSAEAQVELQTKAVNGVIDVFKGAMPKYLVNKKVR